MADLGTFLAGDPNSTPSDGDGLVYNSTIKRWVPSAAGSGGGGTDPEVVRDTMAAALVAGTGVSITPNDAADTITIAATGTGGTVSDATTTTKGIVELATTAETTAGTDTVRAVTPAGVKAVADTKAAASHTHTSASVTDLTEAVQDIVGAMLTGASGVSVTYDDATGKVTITATGGSGTTQTTATAPTLDDDADTYTIPTRTGVDYYVDGVKQTAGTKAWSDTDTDVVVTAQPQAGYTLTGTVSWTLDFTKKAVVSNLALIDNGDGTFTASGASVVDNGDNTFTINDPAASLAGDLFTLSV